jgi:hypothetical protein
MLQCARGGSGLLDERRILLRDLVHLTDCGRDLLDTRGLLDGCRRDLGHDGRHALHRTDYLVHRLMRTFDTVASPASVVVYFLLAVNGRRSGDLRVAGLEENLGRCSGLNVANTKNRHLPAQFAGLLVE